jgi:hypothetical protein
MIGDKAERIPALFLFPHRECKVTICEFELGKTQKRSKTSGLLSKNIAHPGRG